MPAAVAVPLISAGINAAATGFAAHSSSSASRKASEFEYKAQTEALDDARAERARQQRLDEEDRARALENQTYTRAQGEEQKAYGRGQYANYLGRLQPYANAGSAAVSGLSANLPSPYAARMQTGGGPMIQIQGPNGKTYSVPASQRDHWLSKGAQIVGGA